LIASPDRARRRRQLHAAEGDVVRADYSGIAVAPRDQLAAVDPATLDGVGA
jgi:hypothetical protein